MNTACEGDMLTVGGPNHGVSAHGWPDPGSSPGRAMTELFEPQGAALYQVGCVASGSAGGWNRTGMMIRPSVADWPSTTGMS